MSSNVRQNRYKISPWVVRIAVPIAVAAGALAAVRTNDFPLVTVPSIVLLGILYLFTAERRSVLSDDNGIHNRTTRRESTFSAHWADIERFEMINDRAHVAVVMHLHAGQPRILPSTRAWWFNRKAVEAINRGLHADLATARVATPARE